MKHYSKLLRIAMVIGCMVVHYSVHASFSFLKQKVVSAAQSIRSVLSGSTRASEDFHKAAQALDQVITVPDCARLVLGYLKELQCNKQVITWDKTKSSGDVRVPFIGLYPGYFDPNNRPVASQDHCAVVDNKEDGYRIVTFSYDNNSEETVTARVIQQPESAAQSLRMVSLRNGAMGPLFKYSSMKDGIIASRSHQAIKDDGLITLSDGSFVRSHHNADRSNVELRNGRTDVNSLTWTEAYPVGNKTGVLCPLSDQRLVFVEQGDTGGQCKVLSVRDNKFALEDTMSMPRYAPSPNGCVLCELPANRLAIGGDTGTVALWNCNAQGKVHVEATITFKSENAVVPTLKYMEHVAANILLIAHTQGFELWDTVNNSRINAVHLDPKKYLIEQIFKINKDRYFIVKKEQKKAGIWEFVAPEMWTIALKDSRIEQAYERHVASRPKTPSPTNSSAKSSLESSPTKK